MGPTTSSTVAKSDSAVQPGAPLDALEPGFLALDHRWRVILLNQRAATLLEVDPVNAVSREVWELAPGLRGTPQETAWRQAMEAGAPASLELEAYRVTATPSPGGIVVMWTDESRLRKSEAELRRRTGELELARSEAEQEKRRLQAVLDALPVGVAITDVRGGNPQTNAAYDQLWRGPRPPVHSVADYGAYKAWWAESGKRVEPGEWASAIAVERGERVAGQFLEIERFDGSRAAVINSAAPVHDAEGRVVGSAVGIQDVSELRKAQQALRESERLYRAIGETIDYGVWVCDPEGRNTYASESFLKLVGLTQEQCSSFGWGEVLHPDDAERTIAAWKECVRIGGQWDIEHRFRGVDGQWHPVLARGVAVRDERGAITCWAGINLDISRLKKTEQVLQEANARLAEADVRKNEFLAMLSHELRNPLAPIRLSAQLLGRAAPGSEPARRALAVIDRQSAQLTRLVDDLLDLTRVARNKIQLQRTRLELNELVRRTVDDQLPLFEEAGVRLELDPAPEPLLLEADSNRLAQVLGNLLQNAVKFTPRGGRARVAIEADLARQQVIIRVVDTGVGLTPEMLGRLFHPFAQADAALDRSKGGLGLGLALVRALVELHGGEVKAHSAGLGKGAEFVVRLPLTAPGPVGARADVSRSKAKPVRVLIIEDNVDAADSLREALEFGEHLVEIAKDGRQGLEKAAAFKPEVVLCDIGLPGMDGYEVARRFRADPALEHTYLVALSGYALPEDVRRAREAGFDRHLAKPPEFEQLEALLAGERPR